MSVDTKLPIQNLDQTLLQKSSLSWHNVNITSLKTDKHIIKNASGIVRPGEMLAIMGSSGAGKTTLLNTLANRNIGADIEQRGNIKVNGHKRDKNTYKNISAYCQQQDLFMGALTPKEHLWFHSKLRNVKNPSDRVKSVISEMGLEKCSDNKIGTVGRDKTLSGGEKKRLSFGTNILIQPAILFADEPTSGLDSSLAKTVVTSLRTIAQKGTSILCTIHQPNSETFQMFDKLMLLSHGHTVYFGPAHQYVIDYFTDTLNTRCPANYNPADFFISICSTDEENAAFMASKLRENLDFKNNVVASSGSVSPNSVDSASQSPIIDTRTSSGTNMSNGVESILSNSQSHSTMYQASFLTQTYLLIWRAIIANYRDPTIFLARIGQTIGIGLILAAIYYRDPTNQTYVGLEYQNNTGLTESPDIRQINGSIFTVTAVASFNFLFYVILVFPIVAPIWRQEYEDKLYPLPLAFMATNLAELPLLLFIPMLFLLICYFLMGWIQIPADFFSAYGVITLMSNVAGSFGYFGSSLSENPQLVTELVPALMLPLICFGGFVTPVSSIPGIISWLKYFSWFPYSTEALSIIQWRNVNFYCKIENEILEYENCPTALQFTGIKLLNQMEFNINHVGRNILIMLAQLIVYRLLSILILWSRFYFSTSSKFSLYGLGKRSWITKGNKNNFVKNDSGLTVGTVKSTHVFDGPLKIGRLPDDEGMESKDF